MTDHAAVVRLHPECMRCQMEKQLSACPADFTLSQRIAYMQGVFRILADADTTKGAPEILDAFGKLKERFGIKDRDFSEIRRFYNALMMGFVPEVSEVIRGAEDPLAMAAAYAMTGNYIDFGAVKNVSEEKLRELLGGAKDIRLSGEEWLYFTKELKEARSIVYIPDNCGEIVMDKLFIQEMGRANPSAHITVMVKGGPALNDATREDAEEIGLAEAGEVADSGCAFCGMPLSRISKEAEDLLAGADLILAKGQANYETLNGCGWNIYYLFMCKCDFFAGRFHVPKYGGVFIREKSF